MLKIFVSHKAGRSCAAAWRCLCRAARPAPLTWVTLVGHGLSLFLSAWPPFQKQPTKPCFAGKLKNTTYGKTQLDLTIARETLKLETVHVLKHRLKYGRGETSGKN